MRNFLFFLLRHATTIFFVVLEALCITLIINYNNYQKSAYMSSSAHLVGGIFSVQRGITEYFTLSRVNRDLMTENIELLNRIAKLEAQLKSIPDTLVPNDDSLRIKYVYRGAKVINSTTNRSRNYLTANAGKNVGIDADMAAVNRDGVVGIVSASSEHYSTILPIINTSFRLSVKMKNSHFRGQLVWNGVSPRRAMMIDVPEHAVINVGDSVVTSGASSYFPEGLMVGTVEEVSLDKNGGFYNLEILLAVDYSSLYDLEIIENRELQEQLELEQLNNND